jgi:hypothetical protein
MKPGIAVAALLASSLGPLRTQAPAPAPPQAPPLTTSQPSRSVWEGVYTVQQARRGALRSGLCVPCHGSDLEGDSAAPLAGPLFAAKWNGKTLAPVFEVIFKDMPNDDPGSLGPRQSADYLAYILFANHFPTGTTELSTDTDALNTIRFEAAKP